MREKPITHSFNQQIQYIFMLCFIMWKSILIYSCAFTACFYKLLYALYRRTPESYTPYNANIRFWKLVHAAVLLDLLKYPKTIPWHKVHLKHTEFAFFFLSDSLALLLCSCYTLPVKHFAHKVSSNFKKGPACILIAMCRKKRSLGIC